MEIIIPSDFYKKTEFKHFLLDTNFFIDAYVFPEKFDKFTLNCKQNNITFTTIEPVKSEFLKGAESQSKYSKKYQFISSIIDATLPIPKDVFDVYLPELIKLYGEKAKGIEMTDLILGAVLQRYSKDLQLLTKNPKDFPKPATKLVTYFLMDLEKGLHSYAVLAKNPK